jgi:hypothetical protein
VPRRRRPADCGAGHRAANSSGGPGGPTGDPLATRRGPPGTLALPVRTVPSKTRPHWCRDLFWLDCETYSCALSYHPRPDIALFTTYIICKPAGDGMAVAFHQDSHGRCSHSGAAYYICFYGESLMQYTKRRLNDSATHGSTRTPPTSPSGPWRPSRSGSHEGSIRLPLYETSC